MSPKCFITFPLWLCSTRNRKITPLTKAQSVKADPHPTPYD